MPVICRFFSYFLLFFPAIFTGVVCLRFHSDDEIKHRGATSIAFTNIQFHSANHHDLLPTSLSAHVTIRGSDVTLQLLRNTDIKFSSIQTLSASGRHELADLTRSIGHYQDINNRATVELECLDDKCKNYILFGAVYIGDEHIIIQQNTKEDSINFPASYEVLHRPVSSINYDTDYTSPDIDMSSRPNIRQNHGHSIRKRASGTYTVELLLVTDYSVYKFWYDKTTGSSQSARRTAAIYDVKRYYAFVVNGIDLRYEGLGGGRFTIDIVVTGIYISESSADSPYSQTSSGQLDANTTLYAFKNWVNTKTNLPKFDYALMFTKLDLTRDGSTSTKGYAFTGTMCSAYAQGIVEEDFGFLVETTAAHELGHGLNARHDGVSNSCDGTSSYIMAGSSQVFRPTDDRRKNTWKFSSCSESEISTFIDGLSPNCLLFREASALDLNSYTATPIGQSLSPDMQCSYKNGAGSSFGRYFYNTSTLATICTSMYCSKPGSTSYYLMVPGFGTSCGNKKWCQEGECVVSSQAPALSESCPFGDQPGSPISNSECSTFVQSDPTQCYVDSTYRMCCSSCDAQRTGISGCEFGDKSGSCTVAISHGGSCYNTNNANTCCETCAKFETGKADCKYGDTWINGCYGMSQYNCYVNAQQCCGTCAKYETGIPGCKFGDKRAGCTKDDCSSDADRCCLTCYTGTTTAAPTTPAPTTTTAAPTTPAPTTTTAAPTPTTVRRTTPATTNFTTARPTTPSPETQSSESLPTIVMSVSGAVILMIIGILILCYFLRNRTSKPQQRRNPYMESQSYNKHHNSVNNNNRRKPFTTQTNPAAKGYPNPAFSPA